MTRFQKEIDRYASHLGLKLVNVQNTRHGAMEFETPEGRHFKIFGTNTPSDWRALRNTQAKIRREMSA